MQAVQFTEHGDRAVIEYGDHPNIEPGRGELQPGESVLVPDRHDE